MKKFPELAEHGAMRYKPCWIPWLSCVLALASLVGVTFGQPTFSPGLRAYWSHDLWDCVELGHVDWSRFDGTSIEPRIAFDSTSGSFHEAAGSDYFAVRFIGTLRVPTTGDWTFSLRSDEAARLFIDGELVINDGLPHSARTLTSVKNLTAGDHDIEVRYLERRYSAELTLSWSGPSTPLQVIPDDVLFHSSEEPILDDGSGGLWVYWHHDVSHATNIGQIDWTKYDRVEVVDRISYKITSGAFELAGPSDYFAARFVGVIDIPESGAWLFDLGSDESAALYINGEQVIADSTPHSYRWKAGTALLTAGEHAIEVRYLERRYSAGLKLAWQGPSDDFLSIVPSGALSPGSGTLPPISGGLSASWYEGVSHAVTVGQIDWSNPDRVGTATNICWNLTSGAFEDGGDTDYFALRLTGKLHIPVGGRWTFNLGSDESARLLINGEVIVDDNAPHSFRWVDGEVNLAAGEHDIEVLYLERRYSAGLVLTWKGPGDAVEEVIPQQAFAPAPAPSGEPDGSGLRAYWAENVSHAERVGHVYWSDIDHTTIVPNIAWRLTSGAFRPDGASDYFAVRMVGRIAIPDDGVWRFSLGSDESAQLYIDGQLVINDDAAHSFRWASETLDLQAGTYDFEVRYLERRYSAGLTVTWTPPSGSEEVIPASAFSYPAQETPFDVSAGGLRAYFDEGLYHATHVGEVDWENHLSTFPVDNIAWRITSGPFRDDAQSDYFALRLVGIIDIPQTGSWTFNLGSDESAALYIDGEPVVADAHPHSFRWQNGSIALEAGQHELEVVYLERRYSAGLFLAWQGPGVPAETVVPASALSPNPSEQPYETGGGLRAFWSESVTHAENVGQIDWARYDTATTIERVSWKLTSGSFRVDGPDDYFAVRITGTIDVPTYGQWTFSVGSDESAQLYIDGTLVVTDHAPHSFRWSSGTITLDAGPHDYEVRYLERRYSAGLTTTWQGPGMQFASVIPSSVFSKHEREPVLDDGEAAIDVAWIENVIGDADFVTFDDPVAVTQEKRISWRITSSGFTAGSAYDSFGLRATARLSIPTDGLWTFSIGSDESAILRINDEIVIDDSRGHSFRWTDGSVYLTAGIHTIDLRFVEHRYSAGLFLTWQGPQSQCEAVIPASAFQPRQNVRVVNWREVSPSSDN